MIDENRQKIEEIVAGMQCSKNFKCAESGFKNLCRVKDWGLAGYVDCLEENPSACSFALPFGHSHFCRCPLRVHLAKKLKM